MKKAGLAQLIGMAHAGMSMSRAAEELNFPTQAHFAQYCRKMGMVWRDHLRDPLEQRDKEIRVAAAARMTRRQAAEHLGIPLKQLFQYCRKNGIGFNPDPRSYRPVRAKNKAFEVPPAVSGEVADAQRFLQRRGHVVYAAKVDGGPEGQIRFNSSTISPAELVATAVRLGFTTPSRGEKRQ